MAMATRKFLFFPSLAFLAALGTWQHIVAAWLPEASAVQQLDGHPAWEPAQKDGRRKAFMALVTEGRNALFCLSPRVVAAGLAVPSQLRSVC